MWVYSQKTGLLTNGTLSSHGYSGHPPYVNDPAAQHLHCLGPIPRGFYDMVELIEGQTKHGPYVIRLQPHAENDMGERAGFLIHGDNIEKPGHASDGCIIQPRVGREAVWQSNDHLLEVI